MKSKFSLIIIVVILLVIGILVYFFAIKSDSTSNQESGLVSTNTGTTPTTGVSTGAAQTGSQVVQILRNLSIIKLDDAVFRNPAFAYLTDISIALPPPANQGRRNPFGAVGTDASTSSSATTGSSTTPIAPTTGSGF